MKYKVGDTFTNGGKGSLVIKNISGLIYFAEVHTKEHFLRKEFDEVTLAEYLKEYNLVGKDIVLEVSISIRTLEKWYKMLCIDGINSKNKVAEELENILKIKGEL